jgi:hypothetical protein
VSANVFAYFYAMRWFWSLTPLRHTLPAAWLAGAWLLAALPAAEAAELVMFERAGCPWCRRWDSEIAPIYPKTPEGVKAPLRRVSLDRPLSAEWTLDPPIFYSPTFVLMENGREIGRMTGYMNAESFWGLLSAMLAKASQSSSP